MNITLPPSVLRNIDESAACEWLETNGLGGYASSTVSGAHTRRYHGLLVAAIHPPTDRAVLLSRLDETITINGAAYELGANFYPGAIHPRGFEFLSRYEQAPFPTFEFSCGQVKIRKTIGMIHGENTVVIGYEIAAAPAPVHLHLRALAAGRTYHGMNRANEYLRRDYGLNDDTVSLSPYADLRFELRAPGAAFAPVQQWYYNVEYPVERQRGFDHSEDLFCYGAFETTLEPGARWAVIASTDPIGERDGWALLEQERARRRAVVQALPLNEPFVNTLARAADQFRVQRGSDLRTIIAGYHWFTDWGRDTMIALPGLCLTTGQHADARKILAAFAAHCSEGMIPNRFPENPADTPEYNTVDATLWFFVAVRRYLDYSGDDAFIRTVVWETLDSIITHHERGTRFDIKVDADGLLRAGNPTTQLTWMDAKIGDWVVTARAGKPVEVNALWYNALCIGAELAGRFGKHERSAELAAKAGIVRRAFNELFWNDEAGCLYDYVDGRHFDAAIRPNQIFALSLPFPLLDEHRAKKVLRVVEEKLYTPVGLRSLDPAHPSYQSHYSGSPRSRDGAYHQGTVWSWLLGPFITALVRYRGEPGRVRAREVIELLKPHLLEAGLGTVSEIFDGEPPHTPRGCIAQAWSVAEILRAAVEDIYGLAPRADRSPARRGEPPAAAPA